VGLLRENRPFRSWEWLVDPHPNVNPNTDPFFDPTLDRDRHGNPDGDLDPDDHGYPDRHIDLYDNLYGHGHRDPDHLPDGSWHLWELDLFREQRL